MDDLFLLSARQMARIERYFPLSHGVPRVDDWRVVSGIVYVIRNGLQWKDAPKGYGPHDGVPLLSLTANDLDGTPLFQLGLKGSCRAATSCNPGKTSRRQPNPQGA